MDVVFIVLGTLSGVVSIWAGYYTIADWMASTRIAKADRFPIRIRRSISSRAYKEALERLKERIHSDRNVPDYVIGIHYGGIRCASEIAQLWYKPLLHVETRFEKEGDEPPVIREVYLRFDPETIRGKSVLIVDNGIKSGRTMLMVRDRIAEYADRVVTCVVYQPDIDAGIFITPDYVAFCSRKPLENLTK